MESRRRLFSSIKNNILYAGIQKETYQAVLPLIHQENTRVMLRLGLIGTIFGAVMSLLSEHGSVSRNVLPAYLVLLISSASFSSIQGFYLMKKKQTPTLLAYMQMAAVLFYGVMNSALFAPDPAAIGVTVIVLITLVPFLLIDVPWREWLLILSFGIFYVVAVHACKNPAVWNIETTNAVSFTIVSCMCAGAFTSRTIHSMADRLFIEKERDTDDLTGLSSRHAGEILMRGMLFREVGGIFVMMDVDDFKTVNDTYGHQYGDHVLEKTGRAISSAVRRQDVACRYGGDEFCMYLSDCSEEDAKQVMKKIGDYMHKAQENEPVQVTFSFGLSDIHPGENLERIVKEADENLYIVKRSRKKVSHD